MWSRIVLAKANLPTILVVREITEIAKDRQTALLRFVQTLPKEARANLPEVETAEGVLMKMQVKEVGVLRDNHVK